MSEWAEADRTIRDAVAAPGFRRAVFAGVPRNPVTVKWVRVTLRPVELRGDRAIQFQFFDGRQTSNVNRPPDGLDPALTELIESRYSGIHLASDREEIDIRTTRKGRISISRKAAATRETPDLSHNRVKDVPLPEGKPDRLLEVMGIADARGRILGRMRAKFTQINEFLKQLRYSLRESSLAELDRPIEIVDCGCGSSYLTLAAHHDLTVNLNRPARILGVDTNDSVIRNSISKAAKLNTNQLSFHCQRIRELTAPADLVLALHACNTATDDAIAYAIRSNAAVFLGVPCCHQELNRELRPRFCGRSCGTASSRNGPQTSSPMRSVHSCCGSWAIRSMWSNLSARNTPPGT
jgi:hypothetical protein